MDSIDHHNQQVEKEDNNDNSFLDKTDNSSILQLDPQSPPPSLSKLNQTKLFLSPSPTSSAIPLTLNDISTDHIENSRNDDRGIGSSNYQPPFGFGSGPSLKSLADDILDPTQDLLNSSTTNQHLNASFDVSAIGSQSVIHLGASKYHNDVSHEEQEEEEAGNERKEVQFNVDNNGTENENSNNTNHQDEEMDKERNIDISGVDEGMEEQSHDEEGDDKRTHTNSEEEREESHHNSNQHYHHPDDNISFEERESSQIYPLEKDDSIHQENRELTMSNLDNSHLHQSSSDEEEEGEEKENTLYFSDINGSQLDLGNSGFQQQQQQQQQNHLDLDENMLLPSTIDPPETNASDRSEMEEGEEDEEDRENHRDHSDMELDHHHTTIITEFTPTSQDNRSSLNNNNNNINNVEVTTTTTMTTLTNITSNISSTAKQEFEKRRDIKLMDNESLELVNILISELLQQFLKVKESHVILFDFITKNPKHINQLFEVYNSKIEQLEKGLKTKTNNFEPAKESFESDMSFDLSNPKATSTNGTLTAPKKESNSLEYQSSFDISQPKALINNNNNAEQQQPASQQQKEQHNLLSQEYHILRKDFETLLDAVNNHTSKIDKIGNILSNQINQTNSIILSSQLKEVVYEEKIQKVKEGNSQASQLSQSSVHPPAPPPPPQPSSPPQYSAIDILSKSENNQHVIIDINSSNMVLENPGNNPNNTSSSTTSEASSTSSSSGYVSEFNDEDQFKEHLGQVEKQTNLLKNTIEILGSHVQQFQFVNHNFDSIQLTFKSSIDTLEALLNAHTKTSQCISIIESLLKSGMDHQSIQNRLNRLIVEKDQIDLAVSEKSQQYESILKKRDEEILSLKAMVEQLASSLEFHNNKKKQEPQSLDQIDDNDQPSSQKSLFEIERQQYQDRIKALEVENANLSSHNHMVLIEQENKQLSDQLRQLETIQENNIKDLGKSKELIGNLNVEKNRMEMNYQRLVDEYENQQKEIIKLLNRFGPSEDLTNTQSNQLIDSLDRTLIYQKQEIENNIKERNRLQSIITKLNQEINDTSANLQSQQENNQALSHQIYELNILIQNKDQVLNKLRQDLEMTILEKKKGDDTLADNKKMVEELNQTIKKQQDRLAEQSEVSTKIIDGLKEEKVMLEQLVEKSEREKKTVEERVKESDQLKLDLIQLKEELTISKNETLAATMNLELEKQKSARIESLDLQLAQTRSTLSEERELNKRLNKEKATLEIANLQLKQQNEDQEEDIRELITQQSANQSKMDNMANSTHLLKTLSEEHEIMKTNYQKRANELTNLHDKYSKVKDQVADLSQQLESKEKQLKELNIIAEDAQSELNKIRFELNTVSDNLKKKEKILEEQTRKMEDSEKHLMESKNELLSAQAQFSQQAKSDRTVIDNSNILLNDYKSKLLDAMKAKSALEDANEKLRDENETYKSKLDCLTHELETTKAHFEMTKSKPNSSSDANYRLNLRKIEETIKENEKLKLELDQVKLSWTSMSAPPVAVPNKVDENDVEMKQKDSQSKQSQPKNRTSKDVEKAEVEEAKVPVDKKDEESEALEKRKGKDKEKVQQKEIEKENDKLNNKKKKEKEIEEEEEEIEICIKKPTKENQSSSSSSSSSSTTTKTTTDNTTTSTTTTKPPSSSNTSKPPVVSLKSPKKRTIQDAQNEGDVNNQKENIKENNNTTNTNTSTTKEKNKNQSNTTVDNNIPKPTKKLKQQEYVISLTGFKDEGIKKKLTAIIEKLGGSIKHEDFEESITHVIPQTSTPTMKTFAAALTHKWLMSPEWVLESEKEGKFIPEDNYGVRFMEEPFAGKKFFVQESFYESKQLKPDGLKCIVQLMGKGEIVQHEMVADYILTSTEVQKAHADNPIYLSWQQFMYKIPRPVFPICKVSSNGSASSTNSSKNTTKSSKNTSSSPSSSSSSKSASSSSSSSSKSSSGTTRTPTRSSQSKNKK